MLASRIISVPRHESCGAGGSFLAHGYVHLPVPVPSAAGALIPPAAAGVRALPACWRVPRARSGSRQRVSAVPVLLSCARRP